GSTSLVLPVIGPRVPGCMKTLFSPEQPVLSPVTNLAHNMNKLVGLGSQCDTPKRRLDRPLSSVPVMEFHVSSDTGLCMDSPSPMDPLDIEEKFEKAILESGKVVIDNKCPIRRINSLPLRLLGSSPALKHSQLNSLGCGIFSDQHETFPAEGNKENVSGSGATWKKKKKKKKKKTLKEINGGTSRPLRLRRPASYLRMQLSSPPPKLSIKCFPASCLVFSFVPSLFLPPPPKKKWRDVLSNSSPILLRRCSLTSSLNDEEDCGFLEILDGDDVNDVPPGMESLLTAPLVTPKDPAQDLDQDQVIRSRRPRGLFRSPSMPSNVIRPILKRVERANDEETPVKNKRRKSVAGTTMTEELKENFLNIQMGCSMVKLARSKSFCHQEIERILGNDNRELIGDFSKPYILPTIDGRHEGLKYISPETMDLVLSGQFSNLIERYVILDCRYPYEFEAGHIKGALNYHSEEQVEELLQNPIVPFNEDKRVIVIFHCEFSSVRGPRMCQFVREKDRDYNEYPSLHYPELYVLKGGYKEFFPQFKVHCDPQGYCPMHHEDFKDDLKMFHMKSKTWAGEKSKRDLYSRLKKL
uniref:M-phase inducer phosphatase n=1 Tax=Latimeria chalumnae TaxID=7897 RepID=H3ABQ6_LATCH